MRMPITRVAERAIHQTVLMTLTWKSSFGPFTKLQQNILKETFVQFIFDQYLTYFQTVHLLFESIAIVRNRNVYLVSMRTSITFVSSITDARDTIARVRPVPLWTQLLSAASPARLLLSLRLRAFSCFCIWADDFFAATQVTTNCTINYNMVAGSR